MPDHLKDAQNTKEFENYLKNFIQRKEREHKVKVVQEAATSLSLMFSA
jgi:hypothetical protein